MNKAVCWEVCWTTQECDNAGMGKCAVLVPHVNLFRWSRDNTGAGKQQEILCFRKYTNEKSGGSIAEGVGGIGWGEKD